MKKGILMLFVLLSVWINASAQTEKEYEHQWMELYKNGKLENLKAAISTAYKKHINNEDLVYYSYMWARQTRFEDIMQEISKNAAHYNKKGKLAFEIRFGKIMTGNKDVIISEIPLILKDFPEMPAPAKQMLMSGLVNLYVNQKEYQKAIAFVVSSDPNHPIFYHSIAQSMIENDQDIELALSLCKKELDIIRNTPEEALKSLDMADKKRLNMMTNSIYARGLEKAGRLEEAVIVYDTLYSMEPNANNPVRESYLDILLKTKKYQKVSELSVSLAKSGYWNDKIDQSLNTSLLHLGKSATEISTIINDLKNQADKKKSETLKLSSINQPAAPFRIKKANGDYFSLADMKGKVVVLDFWATWCSPCIAAFPGFQKISDKYKSNPKVLVLAINREELGNPKEDVINYFKQKHQKMSDFLTSRKYTFSSYYDTDQIAEKYNINALPTTIFIDKNGQIRFFANSSANESEMVQQFSDKIDFLLNDK
ncbi:TlpA disulfide reductase family protein [Pedobacter frigoris]|uniref:TlpA disulfide reductase family protein n=1 Tax=Pedobacter frigoris TaxID=2571272 RepID=UPI00292E33A9|nr:TlpA disulfide reductase family protein [Pedobacter frigoris]